MSLEDPGSVSFAGIGGLGDQVRELREVIELPLMNPELFEVRILPLFRSSFSSCLFPTSASLRESPHAQPRDVTALTDLGTIFIDVSS